MKKLDVARSSVCSTGLLSGFRRGSPLVGLRIYSCRRREPAAPARQAPSRQTSQRTGSKTLRSRLAIVRRSSVREAAVD